MQTKIAFGALKNNLLGIGQLFIVCYFNSVEMLFEMGKVVLYETILILLMLDATPMAESIIHFSDTIHP